MQVIGKGLGEHLEGVACGHNSFERIHEQCSFAFHYGSGVRNKGKGGTGRVQILFFHKSHYGVGIAGRIELDRITKTHTAPNIDTEVARFAVGLEGQFALECGYIEARIVAGSIGTIEF